MANAGGITYDDFIRRGNEFKRGAGDEIRTLVLNLGTGRPDKINHSLIPDDWPYLRMDCLSSLPAGTPRAPRRV